MFILYIDVFVCCVFRLAASVRVLVQPGAGVCSASEIVEAPFHNADGCREHRGTPREPLLVQKTSAFVVADPDIDDGIRCPCNHKSAGRFQAFPPFPGPDCPQHIERRHYIPRKNIRPHPALCQPLIHQSEINQSIHQHRPLGRPQEQDMRAAIRMALNTPWHIRRQRENIVQKNAGLEELADYLLPVGQCMGRQPEVTNWRGAGKCQMPD